VITGEIRELIQDLNLRVKKDYQNLGIEQLSKELKESMEFERQTFQKIEEYEKKGVEQDLADYAKLICKNTIGREISDIQEFYFKRIDTEYLDSK